MQLPHTVMVQAKLSREYGLIVKENAALKQDMHSLQTGPSRVTDSTGGCIEGKNAEALHLADRKVLYLLFCRP